MKEFKSKFSGEARLWVENYLDGVNIQVHAGDGNCVGVTISQDDAPALALAILKESGVEGNFRTAYDSGTPEHLEQIVGELGTYIERRNELAAEQAEQEELEAEALELMNSYLEAIGKSPQESFNYNHYAITRWKTVARKARELGAKK